MDSAVPGSVAVQGSYWIVRPLAAFPIACFTCALLTDIAYVQSTNVMWADFSAWLLATGLGGGVLAGLVGLVIWAVGWRGRSGRPNWALALGSLLTLLIALFNNLIHSRDGWTSVMPMGLALSVIPVLVMLATGWLATGWFGGVGRS